MKSLDWFEARASLRTCLYRIAPAADARALPADADPFHITALDQSLRLASSPRCSDCRHVNGRRSS